VLGIWKGYWPKNRLLRKLRTTLKKVGQNTSPRENTNYTTPHY